MIATTNPHNGKLIKEFDELTDTQVAEKIDKAHTAFQTWKDTTFKQRAEIFYNLATLLRTRKEELGAIATLEMGKTHTQAIAELEKCCWTCEYYADNAEQQLSHHIIETEASESYVQFDPLGVILAVMPWNFPYWQVIRFLAPTLMAGNTGLLKHASNVPQVALKIEELCLEAGMPEGVFQTLLIGSSKVEQVINDDRVKGVSLTGSEYAGMKVAEAAGRNLKKQVLELGGSDPFIVLPDADMEWTIDQATMARLRNNGQSCVAAKRFIVFKEVAEEFTKKFIEAFEKQKIGDPMTEVDIGPLVNEQAAKDLDELVQDAKSKGARILIGGKKWGTEGYYYAPTIVTDITKEMHIYSEETFGPVASLYIVETGAEAIELANDTRFGLGSSIFTKDTERAKKMAKHINAGSVFINKLVTSHPHLPFGGVNKSGYGRELGEYGIKEFVNVKTVFIK